MSQQSLNTMNKLEGESQFDVRRSRLRLLVDIPDTYHPVPEQACVGKTLSVSSMTLKIDRTCPRCALTTHGFYNLPQDVQIARKLVANNEGNLGIYASLAQTGN